MRVWSRGREWGRGGGGAGLRLAVLACALLAAAGPTRATPLPAFRVVVHVDNPVASVTRSELARIFLKKRRTWPGGLHALVIERPESLPLRHAFSAGVLGRDVQAVNTYWQAQVLTGRASAPVEKETDLEAMTVVAAHRGAVTYVGAETPLVAGVKLLRVEP
ncbi:MAG TPA: hypothetical protein VEA99_07535 [Gemmatimonadaceae bacterium]|nr:hypothetical protein [Gemmatimonadaceae bacterium]